MGAGARLSLATFLPSPHRFVRGEWAVLDCGARLHGYHGDMCRTVVVGGPKPEQRAMLEAVAAANGAAVKAARPGVKVDELRRIAADAIGEAGYGEYWWDAFMPHGNGAGQHEAPNAKDHPELPIREGMVLCIEPGIMLPGVGACILEQMIAVTSDGAEVLNQLPIDMWDRV
jgi:Xaa-Pro aminopeptidase